MKRINPLVPKLLTNVSRGLFQDPSRYISESVLTNIPVKQTSGKIGSYGKSHLRIVNSFTGGRAKTARIHVDTPSSDTYLIEKHALADLLTEESFDNYEKPFDARKDAMMFIMSMIWLGKEKALADALGSTGVMSTNTTLSGTSQWSDYNNSTPLTDIKTGRIAVKDGCGFFPNACILSDVVAEHLSYHPQVLENLGFAQNRAGTLSMEDLKKALKVKYLYIGSAVYNSAQQGQTDTIANVWGKNCILYYRAEDTMRTQSLGYYLSRKGQRRVFVDPEKDPPESELIQVVDEYDFLFTDYNCGYLIKDATA